jgi:hypothetical protein
VRARARCGGTVEAAIDLGVRSLAVYAFSTENWTAAVDEVESLMEIFGETIERELPDLAKAGRAARASSAVATARRLAPGADGRARDGDGRQRPACRSGLRSTTAAAPSWSTRRAG